MQATVVVFFSFMKPDQEVCLQIEHKETNQVGQGI